MAKYLAQIIVLGGQVIGETKFDFITNLSMNSSLKVALLPELSNRNTLLVRRLQGEEVVVSKEQTGRQLMPLPASHWKRHNKY